MFEHQMVENVNKLVTIVDENHLVISQMIEYLYTQRVQLEESTVVDLLICCDRYGVEDLKKRAEEYISQRWNAMSLDSEEIEDLYAIAETTRSHLLQNKVEVLIIEKLLLPALNIQDIQQASVLIDRYSFVSKYLSDSDLRYYFRQAVQN